MSLVFQSLYDEGTETTRRQLLSSCLSLQIACDDTVDQLIEMWRSVVKRVYHYYQLSAKAYFTYLVLGEQVGCCSYLSQILNSMATMAVLVILATKIQYNFNLLGVHLLCDFSMQKCWHC